jgi:hypothetical protein
VFAHTVLHFGDGVGEIIFTDGWSLRELKQAFCLLDHLVELL